MPASNSTYVKPNPKTANMSSNPFERFKPDFKGDPNAERFARAAYERHERVQAAARVNSSFWFVAMLLIGVLLRLYGLRPSVEFDVDEDGNLREDTEESIRKRILAARRVVRACGFLAFGLDPVKAVSSAFLCEDGSYAVGTADARAMLGEYVSSGTNHFHGVNVLEFLGMLNDVDVGELVNPTNPSESIPNVGLPTAGIPHPRVSREDEARVVTQVDSMSIPQLMLHFKQRLVSCDCFKEQYYSGCYPIPSSKRLSQAKDPVFREALSCFEVLHQLCRQLTTEMPLCDVCHSLPELNDHYQVFPVDPGLSKVFEKPFKEGELYSGGFKLSYGSRPKVLKLRKEDPVSGIEIPPPYKLDSSSSVRGRRNSASAVGMVPPIHPPGTWSAASAAFNWRLMSHGYL
jgi:hypothetical protein